MKAIDLNGAAIEMNKLAFSLGPTCRPRPAARDQRRALSRVLGAAPVKRTLDETIAHRAGFLTDYQNEAYSKRYLAEVARVRAAEAKASPAAQDLTEAFAKGLFKLMAYKDEYEVARLYTDGEFAKTLKEQFDGDPGIKVSLAPPLLAQRDKSDGPFAQARIRRLDPWGIRYLDALQILARHRVRSVRIYLGAPDGTGTAGRVFGDDLPSPRHGQTAGLAATGSAGEIGRPRARLRPHQGSQRRALPAGMRAARGRDRAAGRTGGRISSRAGLRIFSKAA